MIHFPEILAINSDRKCLTNVEAFLKKIFNGNNLPEESFNKVLLVVSEAVINAIEHGNKNDLNKKVIIKALCRKNDLIFEVRDEGNGFDYNQIADPTLQENIRKEAGRGIFIMKSLCNRLKFREQGKCVEIQMEIV